MTRREQSARRGRPEQQVSKPIGLIEREALLLGLSTSQAITWDDCGAKFTRSLARYRADTQLEPDVRWHTYSSSTRVLAARCGECSKGVAHLCISAATPWRTTKELARYAFWRRFNSEGGGCTHFGLLPDPETLTRDIARARRSRAGLEVLQPDSPPDLAEFGGTNYGIRVMPTV